MGKNRMTKIDIISGFLGAGKTTLIKKLIQEGFTGEKLVLIENEFGEIGIDGGFLKDAGVEITEMNSGCICCSLVGDFSTALSQVLERFSPDRILIEPSGVGKLSDVIKAVMGVVEKNSRVVLNSAVTVADASKCRMYMKNFGEFYNNQVEHAGTIILSRTQKLADEKAESCVRELRAHNENAAIITTPWDSLSGQQILAAMEKKQDLTAELLKEEEICPVCGGHHGHEEEHEHGVHHHGHEEEHEHGVHHHGHEEEHEHGAHHHGHEEEHEHGVHHHGHEEEHEHGAHHHRHADDVFSSWGRETPHKYTEEELRAALAALSESAEYGTILRAKGIVPEADGGWLQFDLVPGEYEIRPGAPDYTGKLCVIGMDIQEKGLSDLFHL